MNISPRSRLSFFALSLGLLGSLPAVSLAQAYTAVALPSLENAFTFATSFNNQGTIVGGTNIWSGYMPQAFSYSLSTSYVSLIPDDPMSLAYAINDSGVIVGATVSSLSGVSHAVSISGGTVTDLGTLGGPTSEARAINESGTIVGDSEVVVEGDPASTDLHAFSYFDEKMVDLGHLGGGNSWANGINSAGTIVGASDISTNGLNHAFSYTTLGGMVDLTPFNSGSSEAKAINASGLIVGASSFQGSQYLHASIFLIGNTVDLGSLGGNSYAFGVNDFGDIVGQSSLPSEESSHATLFSGGKIWDLNTITQNLGEDTLQTAFAVNNSGQILASSGSQSYLLNPVEAPVVTPVPEPSTYGLMGAAVLGAFSYVRRRRRRAV